MGSAAFNPALTGLDQGAGRVDIAAALDASLIAASPSVSFGLALWPHEDDEVATRSVDYRNLGPAVELQLELDIVGPDGLRPPDEMFSISQQTLSIPEGGTASVMLTADTSVPAPDGVYSGRLIASDGIGRTISVPIVVQREVESYDLEVQHINREGEPSSDFGFGFIIGLDTDASAFITPAAPGATDYSVRLPKGRYAIDSFINEDDLTQPINVFAAPNYPLESNQVLVFDARAATPVSVSVSNPRAELHTALLTLQTQTFFGPLGVNIGFGNYPGPIFYTSTLGPPAPEMFSWLEAYWFDSAATPRASYSAAWTEEESLPEGHFAMEEGRAAVVHASYAATMPSPQPLNEIMISAWPEGAPGYAIASFPNVELPHRMTEYYYTEGRATRWVNFLWMHDDEAFQSMLLGWVPRTYREGRTYTSHWNEPPFGPVLPDAFTFSWAYREGDLLVIDAPTHGDREGHAGFLTHEGQVLLHRDGELIHQAALDGFTLLIDVPPEPANYQLELDLGQSMLELTSREKIVWTFESAHVAGSAQHLPWLSVHFQPDLDRRGRAPRGRFSLPFELALFGEKHRPHVTEPVLEVSYDDGATWARARVKRSGQDWSAVLEHPRRAEYVSLRARVNDRHGNGIEQTLIRAYGLE
jgi:hypothetical protein